MKRHQATRFTVPKIALSLGLAMFAAACSDSDTDNAQGVIIGDASTYSSLEIEALVDAGETEKAIAVIRARSERRLATVDDYVLLAGIHLSRLDGQAAEAALDQAIMTGATNKAVALQMAKALALQGRNAPAKRQLQLVPMSGSDGFNAVLLRGRIEVAEGDVDSATRYFGFARELDPSSPEVDIAVALMELSEGNMEAAFELAQKARTNTAADKNAKPDYIMGAVSRMRGEEEQAISYLENALAISPDDLLSQLELTAALIDAEQLSEAQATLDKTLSRNPDNLIAQFYVAYILWQEGNSTGARELLFQSPRILQAYRPAQKLAGNILFEQDLHEDAIPYYEQYLDDVPNDIEIRVKLATSLRRAGRHVDAAKALNPVLETPENASTQVASASEPQRETSDESSLVRVRVAAIAQAARAEIAQNNFDAAKQKYNEAIERAQALSPADPKLVASIAASLANVEFTSGNRARGLDLMSTVVQSAEPNADHLATLANMQMVENRLDDANETLKRLESLYDRDPLADNVAGTLAFQRGDYDAAIASFSKAITINPDYQSAIKNRAAAYIRKARFKDALTDLEKLEPLVKNDGQFFGMLGQVQQSLGNFVAAITAYETALELVPNSAAFNANYALMLAQKSRLDEAVVAAERALELMPRSSPGTAKVETLLKELREAIDRRT